MSETPTGLELRFSLPLPVTVSHSWTQDTAHSWYTSSKYLWVAYKQDYTRHWALHQATKEASVSDFQMFLFQPPSQGQSSCDTYLQPLPQFQNLVIKNNYRGSKFYKQLARVSIITKFSIISLLFWGALSDYKFWYILVLLLKLLFCYNVLLTVFQVWKFLWSS